MKRMIAICTLALLAALVLLLRLVREPASTTVDRPAAAKPAPTTFAAASRATTIERDITIVRDQPIPPGLPAWSEPLATMPAEPPALDEVRAR